MAIRHVVVLMLENRSLDSMLGRLYPKSAGFDGLGGDDSNTWHKPDGSQEAIGAWTEPAPTPAALTIPDPDPGELFADIEMQLYGVPAAGRPASGSPAMSGFVDNYVRQPAKGLAPDPRAVMHYFATQAVPVLSGLARAFGVSDRWHASAPCQTWPNRFFVHTGTANGYVNNSPTHFPYLMETVFDRLEGAGQSWRIYFHDFPQSATLARLWGPRAVHFRHFEHDFAQDAVAGTLPAYSFIEPRYFADKVLNRTPNDEHPPHNVADGEALVAAVYNAVRGGPGWQETLLVVTFDEHGGLFDHVAPPPAASPGGPSPDGFLFDRFGVRVPAVIVSPYIRAGSVIRPPASTPFDHTSIIATLRKLFGFAPLTPRDAAAPDLVAVLGADPANDGPSSIAVPAAVSAPAEVARLAALPPNSLQRSLAAAAASLPTFGAAIDAHMARLQAVPQALPTHPTVGDAAAAVAAHMRRFLGRS
jgi:phospholipase C